MAFIERAGACTVTGILVVGGQVPDRVFLKQLKNIVLQSLDTTNTNIQASEMAVYITIIVT